MMKMETDFALMQKGEPMRAIDADRLLTNRMKSKYYHLPNGDIAIPIIDIENAPTIEPDILPDGTLMIEVLELDNVHRVLVSSGKRCKVFYVDEDTDECPEDVIEPKKCDTCKHEKERWFSRCADCSDYELWESKQCQK